MPKSDIVVDLITGAQADRPRESNAARTLRKVENLDLGPAAGGRNAAVSIDGTDLVSVTPLQSAPVMGALGNFQGYYNQSPTNYHFHGTEVEDDTDTFYDMNEMSFGGTMSLIAIKIPGVRQLVFTFVWNGDGYNTGDEEDNPLGAWAGKQGFVAGVFQKGVTPVAAHDPLAGFVQPSANVNAGYSLILAEA